MSLLLDPSVRIERDRHRRRQTRRGAVHWLGLVFALWAGGLLALALAAALIAWTVMLIAN